MASEESAVERAWSSHDIVIAILETMAPGPPLLPPSIYPYDRDAWTHRRRQNQIALANVARVSQALSGLALDVLWSFIGSIFELVHLVPSCYTYERSYDYPGPEVRIVSSCVGVCESTLQILIDQPHAPYRISHGVPTNGSYVLFVRTPPGYESFTFQTTPMNMTLSTGYYIGSPRTPPYFHACAD